jgi:TfoX/Sxy family transcriptional regulator of competence genes
VARTPEEIFERLVPERLRDPGVRVGRMYGSSPRGLTVNGKIFAFMSEGRLVVKLSEDRVEELAASGVGQPHTLGKRVMKEWLALDAGVSRRWSSLMVEAQEFVGSTRKAERSRRR